MTGSICDPAFCALSLPGANNLPKPLGCGSFFFYPALSCFFVCGGLYEPANLYSEYMSIIPNQPNKASEHPNEASSPPGKHPAEIPVMTFNEPFVPTTHDEQDSLDRAKEFHSRILSRAQFDPGGELSTAPPEDAYTVGKEADWERGVVGSPHKGDPFLKSTHDSEYASTDDTGSLISHPEDYEHSIGQSAKSITPNHIAHYIHAAKRTGHMVQVTTDSEGQLRTTRARDVESDLRNFSGRESDSQRWDDKL